MERLDSTPVMSSFLPVRKPMVVLLWNAMRGVKGAGGLAAGGIPAVCAKAPPT